jgi:hypothetical protein
MAWTLIVGGASTVLDAAAVERCAVHLASLAQDTMQLTVAAAVDAAALGARGATILLRKDSTTIFAGTIDRVSPGATGTTEGHEVLAKNAWAALDELPFMQSWQIANATTGVVTTRYKSRLILGQTAAGAKQTVGAALTEILAYAVTCGISIQAGTIDTGPEFPWEEICDLTCGQAIQRLTRWCPDMASWVDYTTTPPSLNVRRRASLTTTTLALTACSAIDVQPRQDMAPPVVALYYERRSDVAGAIVESLEDDVYPIGASPQQAGALVSTMQLAGGKSLLQTQYVGASAYPTTDIGWDVWWKLREPWLAGARIANLTLHDPLRGGILANELIVGRIEDWMSCTKEEETITVLADYDLTTAGGVVIEKKRNQLLQQKVTSTNSPTKKWIRPDQITGAEPKPSGLAQALYEALATPYYEGALTVEAEDATTALRPGLLLLVSGGPAAWATMSSAIIQQVDHDVGTGSTSLRFGPPGHLAIQDMRALMATNRRRTAAESHLCRLDADGGKRGNVVDHDSLVPRGWTTPAGGEVYYQRLVGPTYVAVLDPSALGRDVAFASRTFVYDVRYNTTAHRLEKKTWSGYVLSGGDISEWTAVEDGDTVECVAP